MADTVLRILVADDEPDVLLVEAKHLRAEGFEVVTATDGLDASAKLAGGGFDLVVLDLTMPGKDGFALLKELRDLTPAGKWIPAIIVSARGELADMRTGFDLQADHYIQKPCRTEDIVQAVKLMVSLIPLRNS